MRDPEAHTVLLCAVLVFSATACTHEVDGTAADALLFQEATAEDLTDYEGTPGITPGAPESPHGDFRVRFNAVAQAALDTTIFPAELPEGGSFPPGSLIVKDVYSGGTLDLYAVMKKDPTSPLSGSGWLWAELGTDGTVIFSTNKKGDGCISCHSSGQHRDLVRVFDLH